jgi:hypothetical protein
MHIRQGEPPEESGVTKEIRNLAFRALARLFGERRARLVFIVVIMIGVAVAWGKPIVDLVESAGQHFQAFYYRLMPIPTADTGSFTVAVAQLDDDNDGRMERLVIEDLREIRWIRVLPIHQRISLSGADRQKSILDGQVRASELMKKSRAQVLVWGVILSDGVRHVPHLFLSSTLPGTSEPSEGRFPLNDALQLPALFWKQLASVLDLIVATHSANYLAKENRASEDSLQPFIDSVRELLSKTEGEPEWNTESRADVRRALAMALWAEADRTGETTPLTEAIEILQVLVKTYDPKTEPKQLGAAYLDLGIAQLALVELEGRNDTIVPTSEQNTLLQSAFGSLKQSATAGGVNDVGYRLFAETTLGAAECHCVAQPFNWQSVQQSISVFREYIGISPSERQAYGAILSLCFFFRNGTISVAYSHPDLPPQVISLLENFLRSPQMKHYPVLSLLIKESVGDIFLMKAPFDGPKEGKASLLAAVQDYREVIADKQAAGESPSLVVWAKLADALQQLGALESGSTGNSRLNEAISIEARFLYPYDPAHASRDWFVLQNWMAKALFSVGERKSNIEIVCQAYTRAIVAERGLAARAEPDVLTAQYNALQILESMKTRFGLQKSSECQAAEREFVKQFGP